MQHSGASQRYHEGDVLNTFMGPGASLTQAAPEPARCKPIALIDAANGSVRIQASEVVGSDEVAVLKLSEGDSC